MRIVLYPLRELSPVVLLLLYGQLVCGFECDNSTGSYRLDAPELHGQHQRVLRGVCR